VCGSLLLLEPKARDKRAFLLGQTVLSLTIAVLALLNVGPFPGTFVAMFGALLPLNLGLATINIYTQVGLVTLIGLISKHGILMVDYANHLQEREGLSRRAAIERAAAIRLRPILMTTAAMVVGMVPLLTASGAGAASRFSIGLVIAAGMTIGTLFTLFVTPAVYTYVAREHRAEGAAQGSTAQSGAAEQPGS
jgi:Cu/Ag efflux pump CusA